jgi:hypothetical protein
VVEESGTACAEDCALVPHHRLVHPGAVDVAAQETPSTVVLGGEAVAVVHEPRRTIPRQVAVGIAGQRRGANAVMPDDQRYLKT